VVGSASYRLGQPLQFIHTQAGTVYDLTLYSGTARDLGFGDSYAGGGDRADFAAGFASFKGLNLPEEKKDFGSVTGVSGRPGNGTDSYI